MTRALTGMSTDPGIRIGQFPTLQFLGPYLPDIIGALVSFGALLLHRGRGGRHRAVVPPRRLYVRQARGGRGQFAAIAQTGLGHVEVCARQIGRAHV